MKYRVYMPGSQGFPNGTPDSVFEDTPSLNEWLSQQTLAAGDTILVQGFDELPRQVFAFGSGGQALPTPAVANPTFETTNIPHMKRKL